MESQATAGEDQEDTNNPNTTLIDTFCEITSSSKSEAQFFLESHNFDLDSAVSTYLETSLSTIDNHPLSTITAHQQQPLSPSQSQSPSHSYSSSQSPSRSRSPSPPPTIRSAAGTPYNLRSRQGMDGSKKKASGSRAGGIRTLSDLNRRERDESGSDDDEPQEYYTGGEKSGMLVQDPSKGNDVEAIFNQAVKSGAVEGPADHLRPSSSSRTFTGPARLLSGETVPSAPQRPEAVTHDIIFWSNGFTIDNGPLRSLGDPENASFLESIRKGECPKELEPADKRTAVNVNLMRKEENCPVCPYFSP
ncbi:unnamed protein product [Ilex paraguariensis]|uniref:SEP domain-containing protein n=1 Tax=Ilex paraguariensis TaxID=185542 RepID=A0ABC8UC70_9AQUA